MLKQLVLSTLLIISTPAIFAHSARADVLTYHQIDALDVQDDSLSKLNNKYFLAPRDKKIGLMHKMCSDLRDGYSVSRLLKVAQSVDEDIDWKVFTVLTLGSAIEGGWCSEFKPELDAWKGESN
jgi:hypothetical protein